MAKPVKGPFADSAVRWSAIACVAGFGGFILWGAFVGLDEGVTASGVVVVQGQRKQIQHLEGGIVRTLHVREGALVEEGAVLIELEPLQSEAARDELAQEFAQQTATLERLAALRTDTPILTFPSLDAMSLDPAVKAEIIARQSALFDQQRAARESEQLVLRTRKASLEGRQRDVGRQIESTQSALGNAREDLALRRQLLAEKLETIGNVQRLEREVASYETDLSRLIGERNEAIKGAEEVGQEMAQGRARFQEEVGTQMVDAQNRALVARERLLALDDRLARTVIRAPLRGTVLNLQATTLGGVVGQGDVIMEIVPDTQDLIVAVRLTPTDRDAVQPGQMVEAQLSAYKSFLAPRLDGEVLGVSADLKQDPVNGAQYYEARVQLDASKIDPESRVQIIPGMPVDAFIASGTRRSFLDYVFEPIRATFNRGTRMS